MDFSSRKERICAICSIICQNPNKLYPLSHFCKMFGAAKSTVSEDISIIKNSFDHTGRGKIEVAFGVNGGVYYVPYVERALYPAYLSATCEKLKDGSRILPGGYIYTADLFLNAEHVDEMATILWNLFADTDPDFIITVETKGIPLAFTVSKLFNKPLVVARRESKLTEGSVVTINYLSGSSRRLQTMSLSKRAVKEGQKALIIDDFIAGGGTVRALFDLMKEFDVAVCGCGVAIETQKPEKKCVDDFKSLFTIKEIDEGNQIIRVDINNL